MIKIFFCQLFVAPYTHRFTHKYRKGPIVLTSHFPSFPMTHNPPPSSMNRALSKHCSTKNVVSLIFIGLVFTFNAFSICLCCHKGKLRRVLFIFRKGWVLREFCKYVLSKWFSCANNLFRIKLKSQSCKNRSRICFVIMKTALKT